MLNKINLMLVMTKSFSVYLDLIRFLAALAVFLNHLSEKPITDNLIPWPVGYYGAEAVTIFFVLSGFVIAHISEEKENSPKKYFSSRVSRLYSVTLIVLPLTFAMDFLGGELNQNVYTENGVLPKSDGYIGYLSSFFFVNEYQVLSLNGTSPGSNAPFWSLSFEATYYLVAGLLLFYRKVISIPLAVGLLLLAGKSIAALLPLWGIGFFAFKYRNKFNAGLTLSLATFLLSSLILVITPGIQKWLPDFRELYFLPWGPEPSNRWLLRDYFVAIWTALNIISAYNIFTENFDFPDLISSLIARLGSTTFMLYAIHYPLLLMVTALSPFKNDSYDHLFLCSFITFFVTFILTIWSDRLKTIIKNLLSS